MSKLERKLSKYAIPNLSLILIICYGIGYLLAMFDSNGVVQNFICLNPYLILHGQIWRLFTWILIPPSSFDFWTIIMLLFYYSIGRTLEQIWGNYRYNVYIFSGMLFTIAGSFILMGILSAFPQWMIYPGDMAREMQVVGIYFFSTYYINMSIFLAFACTFPENRVLLMFFIPIKMKWLGIAYSALLIYEVLAGNIYSRVVIIASLLNFVVFFLRYRNQRYGSPRARMQQAQRRYQFEKEMKAAAPDFTTTGVSKHKCAICGRTEKDNPDLQFRFCSKCNGNYEYCNEHLFSHKHVE